MNGRSHRILGAGAWICTASVAGAPPLLVSTGLPFALIGSAGWCSPDVDNTPVWKRADRWIWDEPLGNGGPLGHRQLMHWWGLPALASIVLLFLPQDQPAVWAGWAYVVGWSSHLVGDFVFGQAGYGTHRGVPLLLWFFHVGVGLKSGCRFERRLIPLLVAAALMAFTNSGQQVWRLVSPHLLPALESAHT